MNGSRIGSRPIVCLAMILGLAATVLAADETKRIVFKIGTAAPRDSSYHHALLDLGAKWKKIPGGAELKIFPGGIVGGEADMIRKMRIGEIDAALVTANGLASIDPAVQALQAMPMAYRSLDEVDYVISVLHPKLDKRMRDKGFVALVWLDTGWVHFFSSTPVEHPADLKKLKIFTWSGDTQTFDLYKSAGFQPVALETNDILPMLNRGMISAVPTIPQIALGTQIFTATPNMLDLKWAPLVGALVVTERAWNRLTPAAQKEMARVAFDVGQQLKLENRVESDKAVAAMEKNKLHVTHTTAATEVEWRKIAEFCYKRIRGGLVPAEFFDEVLHILAEYRSTHTAGRSPGAK